MPTEDIDPDAIDTDEPETEPVDPIDAVGHRDPGAYYDVLASRGPHRDRPDGHWIVASAAEVAEVLHHPAAAVRPAGEPVPDHLVGTPAGRLFGRLVRMRDDVRRPELRAAVESVFRSISGDHVDAACRDAIVDVSKHMPAVIVGDWIDRFVREFPVAVLARLCGVTSIDLGELVEAARDVARCFAPGAPASAERAGSVAADRLQRAVAGATGASVAAVLAAAVGPADGVANAAGLFFQSFDATAGLIGSSIVHLERGWDRSTAELVDHVLHIDPPVHNTRRFMTADVSIGGISMRRGDAVLLVVAAAARSSTSSETFAFGAGRHRCPASSLVPTLATHAVGALTEWSRGRALPPTTGFHPSQNVRMPAFWTGLPI